VVEVETFGAVDRRNDAVGRRPIAPAANARHDSLVGLVGLHARAGLDCFERLAKLDADVAGRSCQDSRDGSREAATVRRLDYRLEGFAQWSTCLPAAQNQVAGLEGLLNIGSQSGGQSGASRMKEIEYGLQGEAGIPRRITDRAQGLVRPRHVVALVDADRPPRRGTDTKGRLVVWHEDGNTPGPPIQGRAQGSPELASELPPARVDIPLSRHPQHSDLGRPMTEVRSSPGLECDSRVSKPLSESWRGGPPVLTIKSLDDVGFGDHGRPVNQPAVEPEDCLHWITEDPHPRTASDEGQGDAVLRCAGVLVLVKNDEGIVQGELSRDGRASIKELNQRRGE